MSTSKHRDDLGPVTRNRSSSANEASKPISMLQRRQTHVGAKPMNFSPSNGKYLANNMPQQVLFTFTHHICFLQLILIHIFIHILYTRIHKVSNILTDPPHTIQSRFYYINDPWHDLLDYISFSFHQRRLIFYFT